MKNLKDLLSQPVAAISVKELDEALKKCKAHTTLFGTRMVRLEDNTMISLDTLANKVLRIGDTRFNDEAFSIEERLTGSSCVGQLRRFYEITDEQIKTSNFLTRIVAWVREYFNYNPARIIIDYDCDPFRLYTKEQFLALFSDGFSIDRSGCHPSSDGSSGGAIFVKEARLRQALSPVAQTPLVVEPQPAVKPSLIVEPPSVVESNNALYNSLVGEVFGALSHRFSWSDAKKSDYKTSLDTKDVDAEGNFSIFDAQVSLSISRRNGLVTVTALTPERIQTELAAIQQAKINAQIAPGQDVMACIGISGAGVSTIVNHLLGVPFRSEELRIKPSGDLFTPISHSSMTACTTSTKVFTPGEIAVADCGADDSASIAPLLSTVYTLQQAKTVKWVVCMDWNTINANKGETLKFFLNRFKSFFQPENTIFAVTQVPSNLGKKRVLKTLKELNSFTPTPLLSSILANDGERVVAYDPCSSESRDEVLRLLPSVSPVENPRDTIQAHYSPALEKTMWEETVSLLREVEQVKTLDPQYQTAAAGTLKERAELLNYFIDVVKDSPKKTEHQAAFTSAYAYLQTV